MRFENTNFLKAFERKHRGGKEENRKLTENKLTIFKAVDL